MDDEIWNHDNEEHFGTFHLTLRNYSADNRDKLTISFSSLNDGSVKRYPYCTPLLFVPLFRCTLSSEFRARLIRMHKDRIGESVTATTIKGWHSLNAIILLQSSDGSTTPSTVKELLLKSSCVFWNGLSLLIYQH